MNLDQPMPGRDRYARVRAVAGIAGLTIPAMIVLIIWVPALWRQAVGTAVVALVVAIVCGAIATPGRGNDADPR